MVEDIGSLRLKVLQTDERILKLVKRRLELAREIGRIKKSRNIPVRDIGVEKDVVNHAFEVSRTIGLDGRVTEKIMNLVINESVRVQKNPDP